MDKYLRGRAAILQQALYLQEMMYEDAERMRELEARIDELRCLQKAMGGE